MATEVCENCGRSIGSLEQPHVWRGHVLCPECDSRLRFGAVDGHEGIPNESSRNSLDAIAAANRTRESKPVLSYGKAPRRGFWYALRRGLAAAGSVESAQPKSSPFSAGFFGCFGVAAAVICLCGGFCLIPGLAGRKVVAPLPSPSPVRSWSPTAEQRTKRNEFIGEMKRMGVFGNVWVANGVGHIIVKGNFYTLEFAERQRATSVAAAWCKDQDPGCDTFVLFDAMTNKEVGEYGDVYGGLKMN